MTNSSTLTSIPENTNLLHPNKFLLVIPNLKTINYFCQSVSLPGLNTTEVPVETPFSATYRHGDKLVFDPLIVTFLVDEDMRNWEEVFNWLRGLTFPENFTQYRNQKAKGLYWDVTLQVNKNSNNENLRFKFFNAHPVSLGPVMFEFTNGPEVTQTCDLTLRYDYYVMERLST